MINREEARIVIIDCGYILDVYNYDSINIANTVVSDFEYLPLVYLRAQYFMSQTYHVYFLLSSCKIPSYIPHFLVP